VRREGKSKILMKLAEFVLLFSLSLSCNSEPRPPIHGICTVAMVPQSARTVSIRGAGVVSATFPQILLIDRTCRATVLPPEADEQWGSILVKLGPDIRRGPIYSRFMSRLESRELQMFQAVFEGQLTCRLVERASIATTGKGFGNYGVIPCEIIVREIVSFVELF